jgi:hypothetical protein
MADRQRPLLPEFIENPGADSKPRVRDCILPDVEVREGKRMITVRGRDMKFLLLMIDTYVGRAGACWASIPTLAERCQIGRSKTIRILKALSQLGIINNDPRRRGSRNLVYREPCHPRIGEFSIGAPGAPGPAAPPTCRSDSPTGESHSPTGEGHSPTAHDSPSYAGGTRTSIGNSIQKPPSEALTREQGRPERLPRGVGWGFQFLKQGWSLAPDMRTQQLIDPASLHAWHQAAVLRQFVSDDSDGRRVLFALCRYVWRKRREKRNPIGFLHALLEARRSPFWWDVIANEDEEWARSVLVARKQDRSRSPGPGRPAAPQTRHDRAAAGRVPHNRHPQ